jgi:hypothetical protein
MRVKSRHECAPPAPRPRRMRRAAPADMVRCAACGARCAVAAPLRADGLEGRFEVRSADLELKDGVYHLNARLDLPVSDAVRRGWPRACR